MLLSLIRRGSLACLFPLALLAPSAQAGLFDDDEARRAILDLRAKIDQLAEQQKKQQGETNNQLNEQINLLKNGILDLNSQLEQARRESASLRGENEQLKRDVAELQRLQKDAQAGVDARISKFEPQKISFEGKEFTVEPDEKRQFDDAMAVFRKSDFVGASAALSAFQRRYPTSGYNEAVLYWLGNAQYGARDYRAAITSFRTLLTSAPQSPRASEAMLSIANCQVELKDIKGARATLADLQKAYPKTEAAQAAKERLASLR
jgi:tol-pal system protein YbgF